MTTSISNTGARPAPRATASASRFPLLLAYEVLALHASRREVSGVRNGADVLLKSLFLMLGGRAVWRFRVVLVGGGAALVWQDYRRSGRPAALFRRWRRNRCVYALTFGVVASTLTVLFLPGLSIRERFRARRGSWPWSLPTQLMISLGAGIYEELLFRVILVSGLVLAGDYGFGWARDAGRRPSPYVWAR